MHYDIVRVIHNFLDDFSTGERRIANLIINNSEVASHLSIKQMAEKAKCSPATVVRFCRKIQVSSYKRLIYLLAKRERREEAPDSYFEITPDADVETIAANIFHAYSTHFEKMRHSVNTEEIDRAAQMIVDADSVSLYGIGASGLVVQDLSLKLQRIGVHCFLSPDYHLQMINANALTERDAVFAVSYNGETETVITAARIARKRGAKVITLTRDKVNTLSRLGDCCLYVPVSEAPIRFGAGLSRIEQLVVVDILFGAMLSRNFEHYAKNITDTGEIVIRTSGGRNV